MAEAGGIKLALMGAIGLLLIEIGLTGKLGSLVGAIIDPASMVAETTPDSYTINGGAAGNFTPPTSNGAAGNFTPPNSYTINNGAAGNFTAPTKATSSAIGVQIGKTFGAYWQQANMIVKAESSGNSNAYNSISVGGSHAEGLFQILYPSTWNTTSQAKNSPYDYQANIQAAFEIFQRDGYSWREWATAPGLGLG